MVCSLSVNRLPVNCLFARFDDRNRGLDVAAAARQARAEVVVEALTADAPPAVLAPMPCPVAPLAARWTLPLRSLNIASMDATVPVAFVAFVCHSGSSWHSHVHGR